MAQDIVDLVSKRLKKTTVYHSVHVIQKGLAISGGDVGAVRTLMRL